MGFNRARDMRRYSGEEAALTSSHSPPVGPLDLLIAREKQIKKWRRAKSCANSQRKSGMARSRARHAFLIKRRCHPERERDGIWWVGAMFLTNSDFSRTSDQYSTFRNAA